MKIRFFLLIIISSQLYPNNKSVQSSHKFVLITVLHNETHPELMAEYVHCLERNINHPSIDRVHVLYNTEYDDSKNRLLQHLYRFDVPISYVQGSPTFGYCFRLANRKYPNRKIILSNPDIYFNRTLKLLEPFNLRNLFLAITRWHSTSSGRVYPYYLKKNGRYFPQAGSQDTWIFQTPLRSPNADQIVLGTPWCEGRIAYQAKQSGLRVVNPCLSIQCCRMYHSGGLTRVYYDASQFCRYPRMVVAWSRLGNSSKR